MALIPRPNDRPYRHMSPSAKGLPGPDSLGLGSALSAAWASFKSSRVVIFTFSGDPFTMLTG